MSLIRHALLIFSILKLCSAYNILVFFSIPVKSHTILGEGYVKHLLDAGHNVTFITPIECNLQHPRLRQIDISENLNLYPLYLFNAQSIMAKELDLSDFPGSINFQIGFTQATLLMKPIQNLINDENEKFDTVVVEWMYNELGSGLAAVFDCPLIWSSSMSPHTFVLSLLGEFINPAYTFHLHTTERLYSFAERVRQLWKSMHTRYYIWSMTDHHEKIYQNIFGPAILKRGRKPPSYDEVRYNASLMLGNGNVVSSDSFPLPKNYKDIGGYHIIDVDKPLPENLKQIMDKAANGVIYLSFGSVLRVSSMSENYRNSILDVLKNTNRTVIWIADVNLPNLPENVHMMKWAPQLSILAHPNCILFITHAGLLSLTEAIYFGVPVIGVPFFADQFYNIDKAAEAGFGRKCVLDGISTENLKIAIEDVLENPRYLERAKQLSDTYHHRLASPGKELVYWIEHVIRTNGAPHLRSNSLKVEWYKIYYLDLLAVIVLVFILIILVLKRILSLLNKNEIKSKIN
ncbi:UDP-glycosyltransferase UGT5-like [Aricia agestis]|uniref:UDP-glycosyltransferase UGT5-like n=1 Tax=Aricia agestis TaxID=91739 RepID=UPI001C2045EC|nr:UDP-glycosyltransferase UGT5-like [Aricia agestis]